MCQRSHLVLEVEAPRRLANDRECSQRGSIRWREMDEIMSADHMVESSLKSGGNKIDVRS